MHGFSGPWLIAALNGAVLAVAAAIVVFAVHRDGGGPADDAWEAGALELAREVRRVTEKAPADLDRASRRLLPLAGRIRRHVRAAPAAVEAPTYRALYELGVACQRVAIEHGTTAALVDGTLLEERLEALRDDATALVAAVERGSSNPHPTTANAREPDAPR